MIFRVLRNLRKLSRSLSVRAGASCALAILAALVAVIFAPYVPDELADLLGGDALDKILTIVASSMLAVVTFSLSNLISSYSVAAANAPVRATSLIMQNPRAQTALSSFLGAFIFSIVSLVALSTGYYGAKGRVILFGITVLVLVGVVWTVIRWIGQLSGLGLLSNVIKTVEEETVNAIRCQRAISFSAPPASNEEAAGVSIQSRKTGFLQALDLDRLSEIGEKCSGEIWLQVHPGQFIYPGLVIAKVGGSSPVSDQVQKEITECFFLGRQRTFDEDPRFGFVVLSEIASYALSPGINDPGTAIEVIGCQVRLLNEFHSVCHAETKKRHPDNIHPKPILANDILDDAFQAVARDGAGMVEVGIMLQKALGSLSAYPEFRAIAGELSARNLELSRQEMKSGPDMERLEKAASWRRARS